MALRCNAGFGHALLVAGLVVFVASAAYGQWSLETLEQGDSTNDSSLKLDALGRPVIALAGGFLEVARWDGAAWTLEEVG